MRGDDMAKIKINDIESFRRPESFSVVPDDRLERIPVMNGVVVQDAGYVEDGDIIQLEAMFGNEEMEDILDLWKDREKVTLTDEAERTYGNLIMNIKELKYVPRFPDYVFITMELWKCGDSVIGGNENG